MDGFFIMHCCRLILDRSKNIEEHPCHSILPLSIGPDGSSVQILSCSVKDSGTGCSIVRIHDDRGTIPEGHFSNKKGECTISRVSKSAYLAMVTNNRCKLSALINASGCHLSSAYPVTDTTIEWTVIGPDSARIHELIRSMRENGYSVDVVSSEKLTMDPVLTSKQDLYFTAAVKLGYYDIPKRITLDELCVVLECSKSTLNVALRMAEKSIFDFYLNFSAGARLSRRRRRRILYLIRSRMALDGILSRIMPFDPVSSSASMTSIGLRDLAEAMARSNLAGVSA